MTAVSLTGPVDVTSRTVFDDDILADDILFTIDPGATLALFGSDVFSQDTMNLGGRARNFGALTINNVENGLTLAGAGVLANVGAVTQNGSLEVSADDSVLVRNLAGASWTLDANAGAVGASEDLLDGSGAATSTFANFGTLTQIGDDSLDYVGCIFKNYGTLVVDGAGLVLSGPWARIRGVVTGTGTLDANTQIFLTDATLDMTVLTFNEALLQGVVTCTGDFGGDTSVIFMKGATLKLTGTSTDGYSGMSGNVYGPGEIDLDGDNVLNGDGLFLHGSPAGAAHIVNDDNVNAGLVMFDPLAGQTMTITNASGALWSNSAAPGTTNTMLSSPTPAQVFFDNFGTVQNGGSTYSGPTSADRAQIDVSFVNNGLVEDFSASNTSLPAYLANGFVFNAPVTGDGVIEFSDTLTLNSSIGAGQIVEFAAAPTGAVGPTLKLNDLSHFSAVIEGFDSQSGVSDTLLVNSARWTFDGFTPNSLQPTVGGALTFSDGTAQLTVSLIGDFSASGFHAAVAGGQTTITYAAPA